MADVRCSFSCGTRGYHECRTRWVSVLHEVLEVKHESRNCHDRYAIAVMKHLPGTLVASVVGHLPREISRCTYIHYYSRSKSVIQSNGCASQEIPLVLGGLEIPCQVILEMEMTDKNSLAKAEYKHLVSEQYQEPVNGKFPDDTQQILQALQSPSDKELDYHSDSSKSESEPECT